VHEGGVVLSRPKSDRATVVSVVVALLALGWGVYAYYVPRTPPAPAVSVAASPVHTLELVAQHRVRPGQLSS
jgi:hypothetical protein